LLARLVTAFEAQDVGVPFEVVIVDDASTDGTWDELGRLAARSPLTLVLLRHERNRGPAATRNTGWQAARGRIVAFTDDDCQPQSGWLAALLIGLETADLVVGATLPHPAQLKGQHAFSRTINVTRETGNYETCNIAYRRGLLHRLGGFDEGYRFPAGEDTDLGWRARESGARTAFVPDALVYHDVHRLGFVGHLRDTLRWEGVVRLVRDHPQLRAHLHSRWVWRPSHPPAVLAGAGLAAYAPVARRHGRWAAAAVVVGSGLPYLRYRTRRVPLPGGRRSFAAIPLALVADIFEVGVMAVASARYRTLVL
jgi:glycosyltransferase involved in cell wall biosynthesis